MVRLSTGKAHQYGSLSGHDLTLLVFAKRRPMPEPMGSTTYWEEAPNQRTLQANQKIP